MDHSGHAAMATGGSGSPTASAKSMGGMGGGTGCKISVRHALARITKMKPQHPSSLKKKKKKREKKCPKLT